MIKLKRVYESAASDDGARFLVERLWPRGIKKTALHIDAWLKDVGPTTNLRKWFSHDPQKWSAFRERYFRELGANPAVEPIITAAKRGNVTLLYSSHDTEHNNAVALKDYIEHELRERSAPHKRAA